MKCNHSFIIGLLACGLSAGLVMAQEESAPQPSRERGPYRDGLGPRGPRGVGMGEVAGGPRMNRGSAPQAPLLRVLDLNRDGEIDEQELAQASTSLKALDRNGDGKLNRDDLRGPRGPADARVRQGPADGQGPRFGQGNRAGGPRDGACPCCRRGGPRGPGLSGPPIE